MFSGIVEACVKAVNIKKRNENIEIQLEKPHGFDDLKNGDSVAVDGVCLTLESFNERTMTFALAPESLKVLQWETRWETRSMKEWSFNLERSLRFNDRVHGHLVTGHIEGLAQVLKIKDLAESRLLEIQIPENVLPFVWKKGSIAFNGVSLTVNEVKKDGRVEICLIPETMKRTNLGMIQENSWLHIEPDYMARAMRRMLDFREEIREKK